VYAHVYISKSQQQGGFDRISRAVDRSRSDQRTTSQSIGLDGWTDQLRSRRSAKGGAIPITRVTQGLSQLTHPPAHRPPHPPPPQATGWRGPAAAAAAARRGVAAAAAGRGPRSRSSSAGSWGRCGSDGFGLWGVVLRFCGAWCVMVDDDRQTNLSTIDDSMNECWAA
jgi:hypothetical protein